MWRDEGGRGVYVRDLGGYVPKGAVSIGYVGGNIVPHAINCPHSGKDVGDKVR